ncbi:PspC domain-containing protein [Mucilaginibacter antarcticus]|uniref:PspC domain-containing protein n=1 Tax=Mucilaginibacter antarcticus TaxID=1855725 RepID=A0ABW5XRD4_9SPHI
MEKKLQRDEHNKMIAGVCAGLAEYFNIDITIIRALFLLSLVLHGSGFAVYVVLWIVMPKKSYRFNNNKFNSGDPTVDYTVPPQSYTGAYDYSVPNAFTSFDSQQSAQPFAMPPKKKSNAGVIIGIALVVFGSFFLLDNLGLIPDWDFDHVWPYVLVIAGVVLIFSRKESADKPWEAEKEDPFAQTPVDKAEPAEPTDNKDNKTEDTPPAL